MTEGNRTMEHPTLNRALRLVVLGGIFLSGCGPKALISGKVIDNFGTPLEGVSVTVEGTQFQAVTNKDGAYKISYAPGSIKLIFTKAGYFNGELALNIATETKLPAKDVTVFKVPPGSGLYLVGNKDYEPLTPGKLMVKQAGFMGVERTYFVSGNMTPVLRGGRMAIVENDRKTHMILGIQSTKTGLIASPRTKDIVLKFPASLVGPDTYLYDLTAVKDGDYAIVTVVQTMLGNMLADPVYPIVVREPGPREQALSQIQNAVSSTQ